MQLSRQRLCSLLIIFIIMSVCYFIWLVRDGLYPFLLGVLLAYLLYPFMIFLENRGYKRTWALAIIYSAGTLFCLGIGFLFVPVLVRELENFAQDLPAMTLRAEELLNYLQASYKSWVLPMSMREAIDVGLSNIGIKVNLFVVGAVQGILDSFSYLIGIAISPVLAFYILYDWRNIAHSVLGVLPSAWRGEAILICRNINGVLHGVIRGQIFISILVGSFVMLGLWLMNIKYALLIGLLAGLLDVIPYFGAIIGAFPAVCVALLYSPIMALKVLLLFIVVHQTESVLIQPKIIGNSVGLHPLSVIFFVFVGEEIGGLVGMLLGVPFAAISKILLKHALKFIIYASNK